MRNLPSPHSFLKDDGTLDPEHLRMLELGAQSAADNPETGERTLHMEPDDNFELTITVSADRRRYAVAPRPGCQCAGQQPAIRCECNPVDCRRCGLRLTGLTTVCDSALCLHDLCPACEHQREQCFAEDLAGAVLTEYRHLRNTHEGSAGAMCGAVSDVLGAESGSAPLYPLTERILARCSELDRAEGNGDSRRWVFKDGTALVPDPIRGIWLDEE